MDFILYNTRSATISDLDICYQLESISYEGSESATKDKIKKRIEMYPQGFLVLEYFGAVVGFINSIRTNIRDLSDENLKDFIGYDVDGKNCIIMSFVVHPNYQRIGLGSFLFSEYMRFINRAAIDNIYLMCKKQHIVFYEKLGFELISKSKSFHGGFDWYEMCKFL